MQWQSLPTDGFVHGTDAKHQDYRIEALAITTGTVLLKITGPRPPLALELELTEAVALVNELHAAHVRAFHMRSLTNSADPDRRASP